MDFRLNDEQRMWRDAAHDFVSKEVKPRAHEVDENSEFNWSAVRKMGPLGLLGLNVEEEFGGAGIDAISAAIGIEELGWGCGSTALAIAAHNGLGCAPITLFGTVEQKKKFLPSVTSGQGNLAALALTEPGAGSDLKGGVRTRAERDSDEWVINGAKAWCTNASIADFIVTLVRTDPVGGSNSLSHIIIPTSSRGLHIGPPEKKMGLKGSPTHAVTFENVRLSSNYLLGKPGRGLQQTMEVLDGGRISIGALSLGLAQSAYEDGLLYAKERQTFGKPIAEYEAIQWMLADAATEIQAARFLVYYAAWLKDMGKSFTKEAAMAKLYSTEMAERVCRNAIQIYGGYGYSREYPVELTYRDARLMTIGEGTSEIQRLVIARNILN
jgi:alkylation response protein AidB-like acyl-CoA dehydrogenase